MIYSAEEFVKLRESPIKSEYDRAAMDEADISIWRDIIKKYPNHRKWVAHNKTVPIEILEELCKFDTGVRQFVASKRKLTVELFEKLSNDPDSTVRIAIAANKKTPIGIIKKLLNDFDSDVASSAAYNYQNRRN